MPTRSVLLGVGNTGTITDHVIFSTPPATTSIVKSVYGVNFGSGAVPTHLILSGGPALDYWFHSWVAQPSASWRWDGWLIAPAGYQLRLVVNAASPQTYVASGTLLPGVVDMPGTKPA